MPRCPKCFRNKDSLVRISDRYNLRVCKGCNYQLQEAIGFLEHYGYNIAKVESEDSNEKLLEDRGVSQGGKKQPDK